MRPRLPEQPALFDTSDLPLEGDSGQLRSILFGKDRTERIVAAEPAGGQLLLWSRASDGSVSRSRREVKPWLLLASRHDLPGADVRQLEGGEFRYLHEFSTFQAMADARARLRDEHVAFAGYASGTKTALTATGITLFKGMSLGDILRMQVDIETEGLNPDPAENRLLVIAVGTNRGISETIALQDEREMLERFVALVTDTDPDVIEGHNIYGFDLPFLVARAKRHGLRLALGRDGSEPRRGQERSFSAGTLSKPYVPVFCFGRHVIDTYLLVQRFDWAKGELQSYGLKEAARTFGIAEPERVELDRARMSEHLRRDRERVLLYARQDIAETERLAALISPTEFFQTQMVPDSYTGSAVTGTGEKINSLFVRAYLAAGRGLPRPETPREVPGGYTDLRAAGLIERVVKADVESLYPSVMLAYDIKPKADSLGVFLPALRELTRRRFEAKARLRKTTGTDRAYWDGLQSSFKVLINSFYGYLGAAAAFYFNDFDAAGRITETGRRLVQQIAADLERTGSRVIEIDTDGVYFVPPASVQGEEAERNYVEQIGTSLPAGIRLAFDGRYRAMISLKTKNYVLLGYDGDRVFRGASVRSRADEPFGRAFLAEAVDLLFAHRSAEIGKLYERTIDDLLNHRIPVEQLARRERVTEKTFTSYGKQRSAAVAANNAVGDFITVYEKRDGTLGLKEDYTPRDENTLYYMEKLYKFACRLREAIGPQFDRQIPKPEPYGLPHRAQGEMEFL